MALKMKQLTPVGGAELLPQLMTEAMLPTQGTAELPLDSLVAASPNWNFYAPLPDDKMVELIASIQENGLLHPIVVWQRKGQPTMVLSGHNRLEAFRCLYKTTGDAQYANIPCTVRDDISEEQAREIIVDSNWVQRSLTPSEKARSISQKYALSGRKARSANGSQHSSTYDMIAQQYGLSGRQIARYVKLGSLSDELLILLDDGKLSVAAGVKLADFPTEQQKLAAQYIEQNGIRPSQTSGLKQGMSDADLKTLLCPTAQKSPDSKRVTLHIDIPAQLKTEFLQMAQSWLEEREGSV